MANSKTPDGAAQLTPNEGRAAEKIGTMRYVLAVSTIGAVVALMLAWVFVVR